MTNILEAMTSTIENADSYKVSHFKQYPEGTTHVSSYIEARGSKFADKFGSDYNYVEFFGLQAFLKDYLSKPITQDDIDMAEIMFEMHGEPFNKEGWQYIVDQHNGKLPIEIRALPEGTVLPTSNALVEVVNTDDKCFWLTSYVETALLRSVWYPTTVATQSRIMKDIIGNTLDETSDDPQAAINFMLQDFGARGAATTEASAIGGMAHIVNFMGTDTVMGMVAAMRYYEPEFETFLAETPDQPKKAMIKLLKKMKADGRTVSAFSVEATEHSTMTIKGEAGEIDQIKKMIDIAKTGKIVSIVSDSYDYFKRLIETYGQKFKDDLIEVGKNGGRVVIRPDSGEPIDVVIKSLEILEQKFGCTTNSKGYKVLPDYLRVLQGDGIDAQALQKILLEMKNKGYAADNLVFGMGGGLLQKVNRDDLKFAMKASWSLIDGVEHEVYKNPKTAEGGFSKKSKAGRLSTVFNGHSFETKKTADLQASEVDRMETVFLNGDLVREQSFDNVRANADYFAGLHHNPPANAIADPWVEAKLG